MKTSGEIKLFLFITIGAIALGGAVFLPSILAKPPQPPRTEVMPTKINRELLVPSGSHIKGDPAAPFTVVDFSDFQCSHCKDAYPKVDALLKQYQPKMNVVFRHYRAVPNHLHSYTLAYAAEAAGLQGKFYEMAELIFKNQDHYEAATADEVKGWLVDMAKGLHLDIPRFTKDLDSDATRKIVERDGSAAIDANVQGTPCFFFLTPSGKVTKIPMPSQLVDHLKDPKNWQ